MSRQDIENFAPQRILLLEELATKLGFTQAILFTHSHESSTVVTTWGADAAWAAQAAAGANIIKKGWGWPEDTIVESAKVEALHAHIAELEAQAAKPKRVVGIRQTDDRVVIMIDGIYMAEATYDAVGNEGMRNAIKITTRLCEQFGIELQRFDA